jgi:glycine betaine catabolism B
VSTQKPAPPIFEPVQVTVRKIHEEVPGVKSLYLDYDRKIFQYKASQAVRLFLETPDGQRIHHPFSIASSPTEDFLLFTTRIRPESVFKRSFERLKPGDKLTVMGPVGRFVLPLDANNNLLFLGVGIAITPFRSMIKYATDKQLPYKITLLYANRTPEEIIYRKEWDTLQSKNPNLRIVHVISHPEHSNEKWTGRTGKIDEKLIREHAHDLAKTLFYICGTPTTISEITHTLRTMNVDPGRVMIESFPGYN